MDAYGVCGIPVMQGGDWAQSGLGSTLRGSCVRLDAMSRCCHEEINKGLGVVHPVVERWLVELKRLGSW